MVRLVEINKTTDFSAEEKEQDISSGILSNNNLCLVSKEKYQNRFLIQISTASVSLLAILGIQITRI